MTQVVTVDPTHPDHADVARAADCLRRGGLVAFPTETVYGLGAHALDRGAVQRLFEAKGRPSNDPLIVHVADCDDVDSLASDVPTVARRLADAFWPGPLTLVLPRAPAVPTEVTAGLDTVAVRMPAHPVARALLAAAGVPVAAPSANLFSRPSPTRASHVLEDLNGRIDMVLDGGPTTVGVESTVVDLTTTPPMVLRPGAISVERLRQYLPTLQIRGPAGRAGDAAMPSPGLIAQHYAPRTPMTLYVGDAALLRGALLAGAHQALAAGKRVGALVTRDYVPDLGQLPVVIAELGSEDDIAGIAARLYAALRELDAARVDIILAHDLPRDEGLWRAVRDRLRRAAVHVIHTP